MLFLDYIVKYRYRKIKSYFELWEIFVRICNSNGRIVKLFKNQDAVAKLPGSPKICGLDIIWDMKKDGDPMYHFDFYRINKLQEAIEIGLYDYLDSGCLCIMEWPENIEELLPEEPLKVNIKVNPDQSRTVSWES